MMMPIEVRMPKLSDNMESGTIIRWLKQKGETVQRGEPLAEVETDKADVELEAEEAGVLREIRVQEGQSAAIGDVIAILAAGAEAGDGEVAVSEAGGEGDEGKEKPAKGTEAPAAESPPPKLRIAPAPEPSTPSPAAPAQERPAPASPLAWRIAQEAGLSLSAVKGSGPGGRILKRDVEALLAQRKAAKPAGAQAVEIGRAERAESGDARRRRERVEAKPARPEPAGEPEAAAGEPAGRLQEQSRMRLTIARRMSEANREIPHFYVTAEIDMSEAWRLRLAIKESGTIPGLTLTHVIARAVALALTEHPRVNASWRDGAVEFHDDVNIGIAVAVEDGLIVPVLHRAQELSLRDLAVRAQALTGKARSGHFSGQELMGATFSISNLGILDVDEFTAVITPPQAAILAVGIVKERPVVRGGQLAVARTMRVTMSCDHRVLNGVEGGEFLEEVKRLLEAPYVLLATG
jgi:pyruvate dehydrogenase E2 component (dihydrolipoamide acetyltransferase)